MQRVATARLFSLSKREADIAISLSMPKEGRIVGRKLLDYKLGLYATAAYLDRAPNIAKPTRPAKTPFWTSRESARSPTIIHETVASERALFNHSRARSFGVAGRVLLVPSRHSSG